MNKTLREIEEKIVDMKLMRLVGISNFYNFCNNSSFLIILIPTFYVPYHNYKVVIYLSEKGTSEIGSMVIIFRFTNVLFKNQLKLNLKYINLTMLKDKASL